MDDPAWTWPAWKFGMKRDALFTTLQDQYNTLPSAIQDPNAFHHDVYEISTEASTTEEFHQRMAERREQRLRELNESLESASFEIIANPSLIGTTQWEYALQLFRTRSLDSLVRYFASYLSATHPWHHDDAETAVCSASEHPSQTRDAFFDDQVLTEEPDCLSHDAAPVELPPSPRSLTICSDDSAANHVFDVDVLTPPRTLSFSDSDSDRFEDALKGDDTRDTHLSYHDDTSSQSSGPETPDSVSEIGEEAELGDALAAAVDTVEIVSSSSCTGEDEIAHADEERHATLADLQVKSPSLSPQPKTPPTLTPITLRSSRSASRAAAGFYDAARPSPYATPIRQRSLSPSRPWTYVYTSTQQDASSDCRKPAMSHRPSGRPTRLERSPLPDSERRRSPRGLSNRRGRDPVDHETTGRVQKPRPMRTRRRERREGNSN